MRIFKVLLPSKKIRGNPLGKGLKEEKFFLLYPTCFAAPASDAQLGQSGDFLQGESGYTVYGSSGNCKQFFHRPFKFCSYTRRGNGVY